MASDEVLRLQVDSSQAIGALASVQQEIKDLEAELETLNATTGVTNAELEGTAKRLEEARGKFDDLSKSVGETAKAQEESGKKTESISDKYVKLGLKVFGARQVLMSLGSAMKSVAQATDSYSGATKDAIDQVSNLASSIASLDLEGASAALGQLAGQTVAWAQGLNEVNVELGNLADKDAAGEFAKILKAQSDLVQGHANEVDALNNKAVVLSREIALQQQSGEVQKFVRDAVQETLDAYDKAGETVPARLAEQAAALGIVSKAQAEVSASSAKLEEVGVKSSEARAAAEKKAADEIVAALEKERIALDAKLAQDQARLTAALAKGAPLDTSEDTGEAKAALADLRQEIRRLEDTPLISVDQLNSLNEMKDRAGSLTTEVNAMNKVFTVANDNWLNEADAATAAAAAQDVYLDLLNQSQARHNAVMDATDDAAAAMDGYSDSSGDAASALGDVADAASKLGDEAKKGADKAGESMDKLKDGLTEAIPLANELKGILAEIVSLGAQADI